MKPLAFLCDGQFLVFPFVFRTLREEARGKETILTSYKLLQVSYLGRNLQDKHKLLEFDMLTNLYETIYAVTISYMFFQAPKARVGYSETSLPLEQEQTHLGVLLASGQA